MKTQFTPIAMRCTQEQFKAIEPKLIKGGCVIKTDIGDFERYPNLCNNANGVEKRINNYSKTNLSNGRKYYETWDEATFLKACGIEVDTYTVSKDFILEAHKDACSTWKTKIENQFLELFPKVEINKWYKSTDNNGFIFYIKEFKENNYIGYGKLEPSGEFHNDWWFAKNSVYGQSLVLATKEEVETALIAELDKKLKGKTFREVKFIDPTTKKAFKIEGNFRYFNDNGDWCHLGNVILSKDGKLAEIISKPIELSLEQRLERIEKHLNIN